MTLVIEKPKQCLNYYGFGHFVRECKNPLECNKYGGDHINKNQTCSSQIVNCIDCGGDHRSNSLLCPELKKYLLVQRDSGRSVMVLVTSF